MKNIFFMIVLILLSLTLQAAEPSIKLYLSDGSTRSFNLSEINNLAIISASTNFNMSVFYQNSLSDTYSAQSIDSIGFSMTNDKITNLDLYINGADHKSYLLTDIDSIIFANAVSPKITSIVPNTGKAGDLVLIYGSDFGSTKSNSFVSFTGADAIDYPSWTDSHIQVKVPSGAVTGKVTITVNGVVSNSVDFTMITPPIITSINPSSFPVGATVNITGSGFGTAQGSSKVLFGTVSATTYTDWSDTQISVTVPAGAKTGKLKVMVNSLFSNEVDYTIVVAPAIASINPSSFAPGNSITINGNNFGASRGTSTVTFSTVDASKYTSWTNTKIVCVVPDGVSSGSLYVTVNSVQSNMVPYSIVKPVETVLIPSGTFKMGNTGPYSGMIYIPETPVHNVTISRSFYMSKFEITQSLYQSLVGFNPSNFKGDSLPVERISWFDAVAFCNKLSDRDGYTKCYTINGNTVTCDWDANGWRLPTEAEWEYACKAGSSTDFYNGNSENNLAQIAWYNGNSNDSTHVGGQKEPNKFGLYDMLGNVFEWVWDWRDTYGGSATDPTGPASGSIKIIRGGSWHNGMVNGTCRSSFRGWEDNPAGHSSTDGIRVVRLAE